MRSGIAAVDVGSVTTITPMPARLALRQATRPPGDHGEWLRSGHSFYKENLRDPLWSSAPNRSGGQ